MPFNGGEDRRVGSDADGERQHHHGSRSPARLQQHPETVAKVSQHDVGIIKRRACFTNAMCWILWSAASVRGTGRPVAEGIRHRSVSSNAITEALKFFSWHR